MRQHRVLSVEDLDMGQEIDPIENAQKLSIESSDHQ
jgi:hypothetical protein